MKTFIRKLFAAPKSRPAPSNRARLGFDGMALDARVMPAAVTTNLSAGVLSIRGGVGDDNVTVSKSGTQIKVVNVGGAGSDSSTATFTASQVQVLDWAGNGGKDTFKNTSGKATLRREAGSLAGNSGVKYGFVYNPVSKVGKLDVYGGPGATRVALQAQRLDLSPGDPGYQPNVNPVVGVNVVVGDQQAGPSFAAGSTISIVAHKWGGQNTFQNATGFTMQTLADQPTAPAAPKASAALVGKRLVISGSSANDVVTLSKVGTGASAQYKLTGQNGLSATYAASAVASVDLKDWSSLDRFTNTSGLPRVRRESGSVASGVTYTFEYDPGSKVGTLKVYGGPGNTRVYFQPQTLNLSPGDPGYVPNQNPVVGINVVVGDQQGGPSFAAGSTVTILTYKNGGNNTFVNATGFAMRPGT
ncbi:MAG: hypothetical protein K2X82_18905 [Gemmataceae bacterium]|nr:hypothetical protein [Gemmataceae bacterium]